MFGAHNYSIIFACLSKSQSEKLIGNVNEDKLPFNFSTYRRRILALSGELHVDAVAADDGDGPEDAARSAGGKEGSFAHVRRQKHRKESRRNIQPSIAGSGVEMIK